MLGEIPLPSAPRSVFEYMSQKDRERLQNFATGGGIARSTTAGLPPSTTPPSQPDTIKIPRTEPHVAQAALRGFQPFATDPAKQARYNAYLHSQANQDTPAPPLKPSPNQKIDEFNKELEDYAKAALLFKPISGAMAGRFTSAVAFESGPKIHEGLHTPTPEELLEKEREEKKKEEDKLSPKQHAAKMGMYGPLTRETKPWQPARLLCKRFGVKDPNPAPEMPSDIPPAGPSGSAWQQATSEVTGQASDTGGSNPSVGASGVPARRNGPRDLANIGLGDDEDQGRDTLTYERPTMDVFKAIFASDDEDSDDDDDGGGEAKKEDAIDSGDVTSKPLIQADKTNGLQLDASTSAASTTVSETTVVDMSSFKPTFIPRDKKDRDRDNKKEKKRKEKKSVLVSFEMDEEGGGVSISQPKPTKDKPKKKRRKEKEILRDDEDEGMWVEKPAADAVKDLLLPRPTSELPLTADDSVSTGTARGRKRAIDFM